MQLLLSKSYPQQLSPQLSLDSLVRVVKTKMEEEKKHKEQGNIGKMQSILSACLIAWFDCCASWVGKSAVSHYQHAFPHLDLRRSAAPLLALRGGGDVGGEDMRATRGRYTRGRGRGRQAGSRGVRGVRGGVHRPIGDIGPARDIRRGGEDSVLYNFLGKETHIKCEVIHKNARRNTRTYEYCVCVCVCVYLHLCV